MSMFLEPVDIDDFGTWEQERCATSPLSWRLPASESLADWKIVVKVEGEDNGTGSQQTKTYDVHRCQLAVPPHESNYFAALFRNSFNESTVRETKLQVKASAAEAFPLLLDFVYGDEDYELEITSAPQAVALRWLSNYLGIRDAFEGANQWSKNELEQCPKSAPHFLREAGLYGDEKMIDIAAKICGRRSLDFEAEVLQPLPPSLFRRAFDHCEPCKEGTLSRAVAKYLGARGDGDLEARDSARELTRQEKLQRISPEAAPTLLKIALHFDLPDVEARCVETASESWQGLLTEPNCQLFQRQPSPSEQSHSPASSNPEPGTKKRPREAPQNHFADTPIPEAVQIRILHDALRNATSKHDLLDKCLRSENTWLHKSLHEARSEHETRTRNTRYEHEQQMRKTRTEHEQQMRNERTEVARIKAELEQAKEKAIRLRASFLCHSPRSLSLGLRSSKGSNSSSC
mmetsp:Transcript_34397/g.110545  ORF Transcript_34397/g.110545 Transcript_34397/m.110545 type:complete len:460 (+) Transcript_34397:82-1461(+)